MGSKYIKEILDRTSAETHLFVEKYAEIVLRIQEILEAKGWSQAELAAKLGKQPSEISRWLAGGQNMTVKSLSKLEHVLGAQIITVPLNQGRSKPLPKQVLQQRWQGLLSNEQWWPAPKGTPAKHGSRSKNRLRESIA